MLNECEQPIGSFETPIAPYKPAGKSSFLFNYLLLCTPLLFSPLSAHPSFQRCHLSVIFFFFSCVCITLTLPLTPPFFFFISFRIVFSNNFSELHSSSLTSPLSPPRSLFCFLPPSCPPALSPPLICSLGSGPVKLPVLQSDGDRVQNLITQRLTARTTC